MSRAMWLGIAVPVVLVAVGACVTEPPPEVPDNLVPEAAAPQVAEKGETIALTARLQDGTWAESVTYRWFQTYGRAVDLVGADTPDASFVAPSLPSDQTLRFRVDVSSPDGAIYSDSVAVLVVGDPEYQPGGTSGGGGSDTGGDVTEEQALADGQVELDKSDEQRASTEQKRGMRLRYRVDV